MKKKVSIKKNNLDYSAHKNEYSSYDLKQELRTALEEAEQYKMTRDLQLQKRVLIQQQFNQYKAQNQELREQISQVRHELSRIKKKYGKKRQYDQMSCKKCKEYERCNEEFERERSIYLRERQILQNEVKELSVKLTHFYEQNQVQKITQTVNQLTNKLRDTQTKLKYQQKFVNLLNNTISQFQQKNLQALTQIETLELKIEELQSENHILKSIGKTSRKLGSIKATSLGNTSHDKSILIV